MSIHLRALKLNKPKKKFLLAILVVLSVFFILILIKHFKKQKEQFKVETNNETNLQNTNSEENECHNFILNILEKIKDIYEPHGGNKLLKKIFLCYQNHKDELENNVEFTEAESMIIYYLRSALKRVSTDKCRKILNSFIGQHFFIVNTPDEQLKGRYKDIEDFFINMKSSVIELISNLVNEANGDRGLNFYILTADLRKSIKQYLDWNMKNILSYPIPAYERKLKQKIPLKLYLSFVVRDNKDFITELGLCGKDLADIGHPGLTVTKSLEEAKNKLGTICLW